MNLVHNSNGQVTESTDGDDNKTKYEYNITTHQLTEIVPPKPLEPTKLTYDTDGRVHTIKDGRGITATYTYDGEDRTTKIEYSDGSSVSFEYDANGNTIKRTDAKAFGEPYTGITSYEYDKLNRPVQETTPTSKTITYGYDYDSNLTSLKDAGGTVSYTYGPDDLPKTVVEPENSSHPFQYTYQTGTDTRQSTGYPNGVLQCSKTDPSGRLTSLWAFIPTTGQSCSTTIAPSATLEDYNLSYTIEWENETGGKETIDTPDLQTLTNSKAGTTTAYEYDALDRVLGAVTKPSSGGSATLTSAYQYDNAGNLLLNHTYSPSTTYTNEHMKYNAANEICEIATTAPNSCPTPAEPGIAGEPTYDADGNMTSDGALSGANKFTYSERDQLASITPHGGSAAEIVSHGAGQEDLAAIGSEEVIQNVLGTGVTGSGAGAYYYTRGSDGELLAKRRPGEKPSESQYLLPDPSGSPAMLTNASGAQVAPTSGSYQYDPYGNTIGTAPAGFGYRGGQALPEGLIHFGARYYDPTTASWTQQDPISQLIQLTEADRYGYVGDDPVNAIDPGGDVSRAACLAASVALALCGEGDENFRASPFHTGTAKDSYEMRPAVEERSSDDTTGEDASGAEEDGGDEGGDLVVDILAELL